MRITQLIFPFRGWLLGREFQILRYQLQISRYFKYFSQNLMLFEPQWNQKMYVDILVG
jgi:hypothetical protein